MPENNTVAPVRIHLPYPADGVRVVDASGKPLEAKTVSIDQLMTLALELSTAKSSGQRFGVSLELNARGRRLSRVFNYAVSGQPISIALGALIDEVRALMSCSPDQDINIRLSVTCNGSELSRLTISRYAYALLPDRGNAGDYHLAMGLNGEIDRPPVLSAIALTDPSQDPLSLSPAGYDEHSGWRYQADPRMRDGLPWLIYPRDALVG